MQAFTLSMTQLSIFTPGLGDCARNLLCLASVSISTVTRTLVSGKNLQCNGDGLWLWVGLCSESLLIVHDRSFMKEVSPHVCSAAVMIVCESTGLICKCTIAEYSSPASSYRGKILGAILTQLILLVVVKERMGPYPMVAEDCNNYGVVLHGNKPFYPLPESQTQSDILQVMKRLIAHQPFAVCFLYIASHLDNIKEWSECTIKD
jgi:hypothetical protein